jgi:LysM repeat protein
MDNRYRQLPPCPGGNYYTIRSGDTLYAISQRFGVSISDLLTANPGLDPNSLQVGRIICIPLTVPPVVCPPGSRSYTIQSGDTFYNIAQRFGTTVQTIQRLNPNVNPDALLVGQRICVPDTITPAPGICPAGTFRYRIQAGDTFASLARRYQTTISAIRRANPGVVPTQLRVGQIICIPQVSGGPCPVGTFSYTIRAGDTLYSLSRRYNTTIRSIVDLNPGLDPQRLRIGQVICIPREA